MTPDDPSLRGPGHPMDPKDTDNLTDPTDPADPGGLAGLLRPRVRRYTAWGDLGHTDPTMLAGRPRIAYLHVLALALAAGADIGAFYQVVQLVMCTADAQLVLAVVLGVRPPVRCSSWPTSSACHFAMRRLGRRTVHRSAALLLHDGLASPRRYRPHGAPACRLGTDRLGHTVVRRSGGSAAHSGPGA